MRQLGIFGLFVAASALASMALSAAALAGATSPTGTSFQGVVVTSSEGEMVLDNPIAQISCEHTQKGHLHITDWARDDYTLTETRLFNCTNSWHVTIVSPGTQVFESTSGYNGEIYSSGLTIDATRFGITCRYATSNTTLGTLTGGSPATIDYSAALPFHSGSGLCGSGATTLTGSDVVTSPSSLYLN